MKIQLSKSAQRVQTALAAAGISTEIVELPASARTALDAATAIGCRVEQIAKSLVFRSTDSDQAVLVIACGANRVDESLVSSHLGCGIAKADADFVRGATGFVIGGVPPLGHVSRLRTLVDEDLLKFDRIWAAAGTPHAVFSVEPHQLVAATGADVVPVSTGRVTPP